MAKNEPLRLLASLLFLVCGATAVVGPDGINGISGRRRELPPPCPSHCFCSSDTVRCETWSSDAVPLTSSFLLPSRTRVLSLKSLPFDHLAAETILTSLDGLRWLRISDGELLSLPSWPYLPTLAFLDLSDNNIAFLPSNSFKNTPHLVHLNVSGNGLSNVSSDALSALGDLKELDLSRNPSIFQLPSNVFDSTGKLRFLDISGMNLESFHQDWATQLPELQFLNASRNNITQLPHGVSLAALETLDVSLSPLKSVPSLAGFPSLKHLFLSHTRISYVRASEMKGCTLLRVLDLSHSNLTNVNEWVFSHCRNLEEIDLSNNLNLWRIEHGAFSNLHSLTVLRLNDCPNLYDLEEDALNGLEGLRELYLQDSAVKVLPSSLNRLTNLTLLNLERTVLFCDCYAHWLPELLASSQNKSWRGVDKIQCYDGQDRTTEEIADNVAKLNCTKVEAISENNVWVLAPWGQSALLECNVTGNPTPKIIWQTVDHHLHVHSKYMEDHPWMQHQISEAFSVAQAQIDGKFQVLQSGQLLIRHVTRDDIGRYKCFAFNPVSNSSVVAYLGLDDTAFRAFILESILFGFACAALFLLTTLVVQFVKYMMDRLGLECCCCKNRLSPKAKQIRQLIESVETYKSAQLEKLRENYTSQVVNIKESCYQQMERLRDSYAQQSKNLKDLCDYSTQQITGARDQYLDQVNKVRDYSMGQMNRVRENYVFQRHRIRKFSGHQLLKLRETYKYQQKTLNKLLETLPDLYIQNCRSGSCQRTDSIIFEDEIDGLDVYYKVDFLDNQSYCSDYYTPNSTLTRHSKTMKGSHSRNASSVSGNTEYQEAQSWVTRQESNGSDKRKEYQKLHSRSYSIATPQSAFLQRFESGNLGHKRSISASSHPSPTLFHPKAPSLLEESTVAEASSLPNSPTTSSNSLKSSSRGTPLYTPLTLTPVHDPKLFATKNSPGEEDSPKSHPSKFHSLESFYQSPPITNVKEEEVQNNITCDSHSTERETNCDSEEECTEKAHLDSSKVAYETSL